MVQLVFKVCSRCLIWLRCARVFDPFPLAPSRFAPQPVQDGDPQASPPLGARSPARDLFGQRLLPAPEHRLQLPGPQLLPSQQMTGCQAPLSSSLSPRVPLAALCVAPSSQSPSELLHPTTRPAGSLTDGRLFWWEGPRSAPGGSCCWSGKWRVLSRWTTPWEGVPSGKKNRQRGSCAPPQPS